MHILHFITPINYLVYLDSLPQYLIFLFKFLAENISSMCIYVISSFTLQDIETILRTPSKYPLRPPNEADVIYRNLRPQYYNNIGMVNENGQNWHFLRSRLTPPLTSLHFKARPGPFPPAQPSRPLHAN